jgi:hypothetical protein
MRDPLSSQPVLGIFIAALVLTLCSTSVASARVFHCASGDVFCLIGSIRSANERAGSDTIMLEVGTYSLPAIDNMEEGEGMGSHRSRAD